MKDFFKILISEFLGLEKGLFFPELSKTFPDGMKSAHTHLTDLFQL